MESSTHSVWDAANCLFRLHPDHTRSKHPCGPTRRTSIILCWRLDNSFIIRFGPRRNLFIGRAWSDTRKCLTTKPITSRLTFEICTKKTVSSIIARVQLTCWTTIHTEQYQGRIKIDTCTNISVQFEKDSFYLISPSRMNHYFWATITIVSIAIGIPWSSNALARSATSRRTSSWLAGEKPSICFLVDAAPSIMTCTK